MMGAMAQEIRQRSSYLGGQTISTIYFGGGTPGILPAEALGGLIDNIRQQFKVEPHAEITVECNPDDLNITSLKALKAIGVNRLSIGIQSFDDTVLKYMNRAHSNAQTLAAIDAAKSAGFNNITVDLMYGIPGQTEGYWQKQLSLFEKLDLPHLSSYCLTIEPKTVFGKMHKTGKLKSVSDEQSLFEFQYLSDFLRERNFEHYEISNFARAGFISKHNSAYWLGKPYLGIGPSAHSYDGSKRGWNVANNTIYIQQVSDNKNYHTEEILGIAERCNDYLLTRLRTKWGISLNDLGFVSAVEKEKMHAKILAYQQSGLLVEKEGCWTLTDQGKYRADGIAADLFI